MSSQQITYTENGKKGTLPYQDFVEKWVNGEISNPTVHNAVFDNLQISGADEGYEDEEYEENNTNTLVAAGPLQGKFVNCEFNKLETYDLDLDLNLENSRITNAYLEYSHLGLFGHNSRIDTLSVNETDINLDLRDTQMDNLDLYKSHITGKMNGGTFKFGPSRTYLGQYDTLVMENVDFGNADYDPDFFIHENLRLINPKMNPSVLKSAREIAPHVFENPKLGQFQSGTKAVVDKDKERLVDMGIQFLSRIRPDLSMDKKREIAEQKYTEALKQGRANLDGRYSTLLLQMMPGMDGPDRDF